MMILYFAYGSNMLSSHIKKRVASAKAIGRASLYDWCVAFSKKSKDGSGKANLFQKTGFVTWGCLYEIDVNEISKLDKVEKGYVRTKVIVMKDDKKIAEAETYISDNLTDNPVGFDSYKQMLILGAIEHNLPTEYILYLQQLPSRPDTEDN
jgi:cation transport regulator ChaC